MKYIVTLNGKQYEVEVEKVGATKSLTRQPVERGVKRERREVIKEEAKIVENKVVETKPVETAQKSSSSGETILSPMPGVILDVKVKVGDMVKFGQSLAVLEAMKMENDIPATVDGKVAEIKVKKGDTVETDDVLIVIE